MYYVRIVFFIKDDYDLDLDDEIVLFENNGPKCKAKVDRRFEELKVILTYGSFEEESVAEEEGEKLFYSVKKQFIKKGIPINISGGLGVLDTPRKSFYTGGITKAGLENIEVLFPQLKNKTVRNELLGMGVYELDKDISEVKFLCQQLSGTMKCNFPDIKIEEHKKDDKINIAYSLLNSSNSINDIRASFLLKISAIESLVSEEEYKNKDFCSIINFLNKKKIKFEDLNDNFDSTVDNLRSIIHRIKSAFGNLKKKSISEKCRGLIANAQLSKKYLKMNAIDFFNKCYKIRSNFVHSGSYNNKDGQTGKIRKLEDYLRELDNLVLDLLYYYENELL